MGENKSKNVRRGNKKINIMEISIFGRFIGIRFFKFTKVKVSKSW
jgi:hypothetical protein